MSLLINVQELRETLCPYKAVELMNQDCQLQEQQANHRRLIKLAQADNLEAEELKVVYINWYL